MSEDHPLAYMPSSIIMCTLGHSNCIGYHRKILPCGVYLHERTVAQIGRGLQIVATKVSSSMPCPPARTAQAVSQYSAVVQPPNIKGFLISSRIPFLVSEQRFTHPHDSELKNICIRLPKHSRTSRPTCRRFLRYSRWPSDAMPPAPLRRGTMLKACG